MDVDPSHTSLPTCYRHPDRETRLACSSCGRPACVDCLRSASVGQKCPECAEPRGRERLIGAEQVRGGTAPRSAPASFTILGISVAVWLIGFLAPDVRQLIFELGIQDNPSVAQGEWYRLFTGAFLHSPAAITHILFNMFALYLFGPELERQTGSVPFTALYFAAALAGGAAFFLANPVGQAVGASGAIFGLFGAWLAAALRNRHTVAGRAGLRHLLLLLGINLVLPLFVPNIAWEAHLGGLVAGFGIAMVWFSLARSPRAAVLRTLVAAAVALAALLLVL